jgi:hypothetical protein
VFDLKKKQSMMGQSTLEAPSQSIKPTKERGWAQIILFFKMLQISNNIYLFVKEKTIAKETEEA